MKGTDYMLEKCFPSNAKKIYSINTDSVKVTENISRHSTTLNTCKCLWMV